MLLKFDMIFKRYIWCLILEIKRNWYKKIFDEGEHEKNRYKVERKSENYGKTKKIHKTQTQRNKQKINFKNHPKIGIYKKKKKNEIHQIGPLGYSQKQKEIKHTIKSRIFTQKNIRKFTHTQKKKIYIKSLNQISRQNSKRQQKGNRE